MTAAGWELLTEANIPAQIPQLYEQADPDKPGMPVKPGDLGRYEVVFDAATMAFLLDETIGTATQLDLALGYEANNIGTSYLGPDPFALLGSYQAASPLVTITGNRSMPRGLATVKWDDEGVAPEPFTLIKDGVLVDYQTTREQAAWLAPYYQKTGKPIRSHGCAAAENALTIPMQHMPNLALAPSAAAVKLNDLVATVKDGILVTQGTTMADFQARTGLLLGTLYEIKNGRVGSALQGGAVLYDSLDLWKHVVAVGGAPTQAVIASTMFPYTAGMNKRAGWYPVKGEPPQQTSYSVQAVAATITNQAVIDPMRKA